MAIYNVKVGNTTVKMDLESNCDARQNIPYIAKVLGVAPKDILAVNSSNAALSPGVGLPLDVRKEGEPNAFAGGKTLTQLGMPGLTNAKAGELGINDPIPGIGVVEVFDPDNPSFDSPYPDDRLGSGDTLPDKTFGTP